MIQIRRISGHSYLPRKMSCGCPGYDIFAAEHKTIEGMSFGNSIRTGIAIKCPDGMSGLIVRKDGPFFNNIDIEMNIVNDDEGELYIFMHNTSSEKFEIAPGDAIARLLISDQCDDTYIKEINNTLTF